MGSPTRPYRGVSAIDRTARRRTELLAAGLEVLGTVGWEQTTMTAICSQAKLTERYFYQSFASRDELLIAVFEQIADEVRETVTAALRSAAPEPMATARAAISAFVDLLADDPRKGRVAIVESAATALLRQRRHQILGEFAELIVAQTHTLFGTEALPSPHDRINALLFVGGLTELLTAWLAGELSATREDVVSSAANQFVRTAHR